MNKEIGQCCHVEGVDSLSFTAIAVNEYFLPCHAQSLVYSEALLQQLVQTAIWSRDTHCPRYLYSFFDLGSPSSDRLNAWMDLVGHTIPWTAGKDTALSESEKVLLGWPSSALYRTFNQPFVLYSNRDLFDPNGSLQNISLHGPFHCALAHILFGWPPVPCCRAHPSGLI